MEIKTDLHTHTIASDHAYSTILENVTYAKKHGLEAIAITDHGLSTPDCPHKWHFGNLKIIPQNIDGVLVLKGAECSYIDMDANLDIDEGVLKGLDVVIGSMHYGGKIPTFKNKEDFISLILKACENPYIDILGHISRIDFILDENDCELIAKTAKDNNKLIELNNECLVKGECYKNNACTLMKACNKLKAEICVNTDAHFALLVGKMDEAKKLLSKICFDENLIVNRNLDSLRNYLINKGKTVDF